LFKVPSFLIYLIADYRSTKHFINWRWNGYESSLLAINRAQTKRLETALKEKEAELPSGVDVDVLDAYYFVLEIQSILKNVLIVCKQAFTDFFIVENHSENSEGIKQFFISNKP